MLLSLFIAPWAGALVAGEQRFPQKHSIVGLTIPDDWTWRNDDARSSFARDKGNTFGIYMYHLTDQMDLDGGVKFYEGFLRKFAKEGENKIVSTKAPAEVKVAGFAARRLEMISGDVLGGLLRDVVVVFSPKRGVVLALHGTALKPAVDKNEKRFSAIVDSVRLLPSNVR